MFRSGSVVRPALGVTALLMSMAGVAEACPKCRLGATSITERYLDIGGGSDPTNSPATRPVDALDPSAIRPSSPTPRLSVSGGVDVTTAYFHKGYLQEDQGLIVQPHVTLSAVVFEKGDFSVTPYLSNWNSLHENQTFGNGDYGIFYESDIMGGVVFSRGPLSVDLKYTLYTYPNGALGNIQEAAGKVSYDVASLWRRPDEPSRFVLLAWAEVAKETSDQNEKPVAAPAAASSLSSSARKLVPLHAPIFHQPVSPSGDLYDDLFGTPEEGGFDTSGQGTYFEVGIEPSFRADVGSTPVGIAFPVTVGMSLDEFYQQRGGSNDLLGYVSAGVQVTVPLPIDERYGKWFLTGSVTYLHLMADSLVFANYGQKDEVIGTLGVSFSF